MELCFIWVDGYRGFSNKSLNLSNKLHFEFNKDDNILTISKKRPIPQEICENINSITALLGVNGSGKTRALQLICEILEGEIHNYYQFLLIYENEGKVFAFSNIEISILNKSNITKFNQIERSNSIYNRESLGVIFFSNVLDGGDRPVNGNIINTSLAHQVWGGYTDNHSLQESSNQSQLQRHSRFLTEFHSKLNTPLPSKAIFILDSPAILKKNSTNESIEKMFSICGDIFKGIPFLNIFKKASAHDKGKDEVLELFNEIAISFILKNMPELIAVNCPYYNKHVIEDSGYKARTNINTLEKLIIYLIYIIKEYCSKLRPDKRIIILNDLEFLKDDLLNTLIDGDLKVVSKSFLQTSFTIKVKNENLLSRIYKLSHIIDSSFGASKSNWLGISSGERAYLNLLSSIWYGIKNTKSRDKSTLLICIDEGDLYLHPQWQIEFVDKVISFLRTTTQQPVQLIFTTHSPLLVTDLPKQCITLLDDNRKVSSFGANIYDIYETTFGLEEKRTGTISQRYIERILNLSKQTEITESERDEIECAIDIIDDELITFHLEKRLKIL
ncbi:AAA family ATPase [Pseudoalteromonas luteoviolacea]|uniref:AAA family ATPase n=1 Tax=Pseudoalteromonas luteoviolacea TaxID=43657 RepID=UPI001B37289B|nr:AAA family ATPase [Pseudoalteromonas luteoviolacea]MBQ4836806.1 AAA family ATPase [Pseudoalteromonas luteoviolacea]